MSGRRTFVGDLFANFGFASRGLGVLLRTESNARFHAVAAPVVIAAGFGLNISRVEWLAVIGAIGLVWTSEALNTAIETAVDLASPERHFLAGRAKDIAAGGVLCACLTAAAIGVVVFIPHLFAW